MSEPETQEATATRPDAQSPATGEPAPQSGPQGTQGPGESSALSLTDVRRLWPDIVEATKAKRRVTWMHLTQNAQVIDVDAKTLTLGFTNQGARESFVSGGSPEILRQAAIDVVGQDWKVETVIDPGARADAPPPPPSPGAVAAPPVEQQPASPAEQQADTAPEPPRAVKEAPSPQAVKAARGAIKDTRPSGAPAPSEDRALADAEAHRDDPDADTAGLAGAELLQRELGATIINETRHD